MKKIIFPVLILFILLIGCHKRGNTVNNDWVLGPFTKVDSVNPIMKRDNGPVFHDPVSGRLVHWEGKDVFNPAAVVRNDTLFLLYRAEDFVGKYNGTSRIGLAWSLDGLHFHRESEPVLYPSNDSFKKYEWEGGIEDPRVVRDSSGIYYMTYTAYDGKTARLCVATSTDLRHWTKHGPVFLNADNGKFVNTWSKSGSIVSTRKGDQIIATRINGKYWMYWGDTNIFLASSDNLIDWIPVTGNDGNPLPVLKPRKHKFDSDLVESGPPALITNAGIRLIYNGRNNPHTGTKALPSGTYSGGQALFNIHHPSQLIGRTSSYFIKPSKSYELKGQVNNVTFLEGLAPFHNHWFLYYGTADSRIAVAVAPLK